MTRFARAKGSKASNERVPQSATPWTEMKADMERKKQEVVDNKEREKMNQIRQENYDHFLKEQKGTTETKWAEFPNDEKPKEKKMPIQKKNKSKEMISKKEIMEMLKPDPEITSKVDAILDKKIKKRKISEALETTENLKKPKSDMDINDAPAEVSSKVEPKKVSISKKKQTKTPLKIAVAKTETKSETMELAAATETKLTEPTEPFQMTKSMKKRLKRKLQKQKHKSDTPDAEKPKKTVATKKTPKKNKKPANDTGNKKPVNDTVKKNKKPANGTNETKPEIKKPLKVAKARDNKRREEHPRRKPELGSKKMIFNGIEIEVVNFDGFPVKKDDADRLAQLKKEMISKGIPVTEVQRTMKLERRKAEKALAREKKKVCYHCRKAGHMLSECPELNTQIDFTSSGICFKCGSTEHTHFECKVTKGEEYKFASCFICREQGHIAKQCPDNPKGLYPQGGACKVCGDVTHLKKDCPREQKERDDALFLKTISGDNLEIIEETAKSEPVKPVQKNKVVKF